jgi:predicted naringenin-chalcone synthase
MAAILGIGTAQPTHSIEQGATTDFAVAIGRASVEEARTIRVLYRRSGVARRGSVLLKHPAEADVRQTFFKPPIDAKDRGPTTADRMAEYAAESSGLALRAAGRALAAANVPATAIRHLVTASCTGFSAPGFDVMLMNELPLSPTVTRTHLGFMGCHAAINALRVAEALIARDPGSRILICTTELCSLHFQYGRVADSMVSNSLFADGAAAVVLGDGAAALGGWTLTKIGSCLFPGSQDAMRWSIGDHGFEMQLSNRVPELIANDLRPWMDAWLTTSGMTLKQIGSWAIHPGGPRIVSAVMSALELPAGADETSRHVLSECGNMSSPTILFILQELLRKQAKLPCVALAFGPGLTVEVALFQ